MSAQKLSNFQYENRVVVVFSENAEDENVEKQASLFCENLEEFRDRKLVFLQAIPGKHRTLIPERSEWVTSKLFETTKLTTGNFELILIGLDGGVKLKQQEIVKAEQIFDLIDSMPMRQAEMRKSDQ